jgi:hypothetical protein
LCLIGGPKWGRHFRFMIVGGISSGGFHNRGVAMRMSDSERFGCPLLIGIVEKCKKICEKVAKQNEVAKAWHNEVAAQKYNPNRSCGCPTCKAIQVAATILHHTKTPRNHPTTPPKTALKHSHIPMKSP